MSDATPPFVGAVYESARPRRWFERDDKPRWKWKVVKHHPGFPDLWELARIGGKRTRRGNLLRLTSELRDTKKWRFVEVATSPLEPIDGGDQLSL